MRERVALGNASWLCCMLAAVISHQCDNEAWCVPACQRLLRHNLKTLQPRTTRCSEAAVICGCVLSCGSRHFSLVFARNTQLGGFKGCKSLGHSSAQRFRKPESHHRCQALDSMRAIPENPLWWHPVSRSRSLWFWRPGGLCCNACL